MEVTAHVRGNCGGGVGGAGKVAAVGDAPRPASEAALRAIVGRSRHLDIDRRIIFFFGGRDVTATLETFFGRPVVRGRVGHEKFSPTPSHSSGSKKFPRSRFRGSTRKSCECRSVGHTCISKNSADR